MTSLDASEYACRADGMRVAKAVGSTTTLYRYDGQMGFADQEITGTSSIVTHYGLGARGVDFIECVGSSTVTVFPLYDGHGNMVATLSRNGTSYSLNDQRSYGAWGEIRSGNTSGDPKGRYVANLGHKQDDESGLIYMRARYYEPSRGRFINEDPARQGLNFYLYCDSNPVDRADTSGKIWHLIAGLRFSGLEHFWPQSPIRVPSVGLLTGTPRLALLAWLLQVDYLQLYSSLRQPPLSQSEVQARLVKH